jgi:hypothetical protein
MYPPVSTAASFVPSDEEAMPDQFRDPADVRSVQDKPSAQAVEQPMLATKTTVNAVVRKNE